MSRTSRILFALLSGFASALHLGAQAATGNIRGTVVDSSIKRGKAQEHSFRVGRFEIIPVYRFRNSLRAW